MIYFKLEFLNLLWILEGSFVLSLNLLLSSFYEIVHSWKFDRVLFTYAHVNLAYPSILTYFVDSL